MYYFFINILEVILRHSYILFITIDNFIMCWCFGKTVLGVLIRVIDGFARISLNGSLISLLGKGNCSMFIGLFAIAISSFLRALSFFYRYLYICFIIPYKQNLST
jgi:hypothetical protein